MACLDSDFLSKSAMVLTEKGLLINMGKDFGERYKWMYLLKVMLPNISTSDSL